MDDIRKAEQELLDQLGNLTKEEDNKPDSEDVVNNIIEENNTSIDEQDEDVELTNESDLEEDNQEDIEEQKDQEDEEEELTGAKFRHKLKEERQKREELERKLQEVLQAQARMEGRLEGSSTRKEDPVEEIPDQEYEPEKYAIWKANNLEKKLERVEQEQRTSAFNAEWERIQSSQISSNPTYSKAKEFLIKKYSEVVKQSNPYISEAEISENLRREEYAEVLKATKMGVNPISHIMGLAYNAGYVPTIDEPQDKSSKKPNIKKIKNNQKKSGSLIGGTSAGETNSGLSAKSLLDASIDDILKMDEKDIRKAIERTARA